MKLMKSQVYTYVHIHVRVFNTTKKVYLKYIVVSAMKGTPKSSHPLYTTKQSKSS